MKPTNEQVLNLTTRNETFFDSLLMQLIGSYISAFLRAIFYDILALLNYFMVKPSLFEYGRDTIQSTASG